MPRKRKKWDRHAIKAAIYRKGQTMVGISSAAGLHAHSCSISLRRPCPSADNVISDFLQVSLHELWPDRYDKNSVRLISHSKPTRFKAACASQKGSAISGMEQAA